MATTRGVDVSTFQGTISWGKVSGIDFAIIRAGFGRNNYDSQALNNIKGCSNYNIPFGLYWFSYALTVSDAIHEADYVCDIADKYNITFPIIAYDWEYDSDDYAADCGVTMTSDARYQFANAFLNRVKQRGYIPILYTNYDYLNKGFRSLLNDYDVWFAYPSGSTAPDVTNLTIWQYSWTGSVTGINADVDMNYCYKDYSTGGSSTVTCDITFRYLAKSGYTSTGGEVKTLQRLLNSLGYKGSNGKALDVDGIFGDNTDYAVKAFQKAMGLVVDGIVGSATYTKLFGT